MNERIIGMAILGVALLILLGGLFYRPMADLQIIGNILIACGVLLVAWFVYDDYEESHKLQRLQKKVSELEEIVDRHCDQIEETLKGLKGEQEQ